MSALSPEVRAWLRPGMPGMVATVGSGGQPETTRPWAARALPERDAIEAYVVRSASPRFFESLALSKRAALNLVELPSYRSRLFKGRCFVSDAPVDASFLSSSLDAVGRAFQGVGMPEGAVERMLGHYESPDELVVLVLDVECVFDQSPKPGAGARL